MSRKRILYVLLTIICAAGAVLSLVMFVTAIRFGELGRILVYFVLTAVGVEFAILSALKLRK